MIPGSMENGYSPIYHQKGLVGPKTLDDPDVRTVRDILDQCVRKYGQKNGFGTFSKTQAKCSSTPRRIRRARMLRVELSSTTPISMSMRTL